ncbi:hypothetical protein EDD22DRAFT_957266 [Suillus occidentalis]|nr:hypothetical protein EDD22DRAFT_957266 [Suillus occidentalis]
MEHGEPGYCYVSVTGEHVGLNNRMLKLWAAAIAAADATKHEPPNTVDFDGLRGGRIDVVKSRDRKGPRSSSGSSPDPTTTLLAAVTCLITSQLTPKATLEPSTSTRHCHQAPGPISPVPATGTEIHSCLSAFLESHDVNLLDSEDVLSSLELTPDVIADVPVTRLCNLFNVVLKIFMQTTQTGRRQQRFGTVIQPHVNPIRQQHRAKTAAESAAKRAAVSRALPQPIHNFCIPVTKAELSMDLWDARAPHRIYYGVPELVKYRAGDTSQVEFLRVPAIKNQQLVGYVPLPTKYQSSWVYLCHCVEYWLAVWKCWDGESKKKKKKTKAQQERADLVATSRKNAGARFLEAMVARRTVLEECMVNGVNDGRITSLDEFLIRDHRDWLFTEFDELPDDADRYLEADPLYTGNRTLFETGWGVEKDDIPLMLGHADNEWLFDGLDVSDMFKKGMNAALKNLKDGGLEVQITHDGNAALPDKWHESHEPPIRFISERKDKFLRDGFTIDQPLVFLYHCLREGTERADFLSEIMDMLATEERRYQWSLHVDQLFDGEVTWDEFSDLVADELRLEPDARDNAIGLDGIEPDIPFLRVDALIAVRAYLRNLQNKPDTAVNLLLRSIGRFSTPDANDLKMWDCVMQTVKPDNVTTVLQKAQDERLKLSNVGQAIVVDQPSDASPDLESGVENRSSIVMDDRMEDARSNGSPKVLATTNTAVHEHRLDTSSPVLSSAAQPPDPAKVVASDMVVDSAEAWERTSRERRTAWRRRNSLDKPLAFLRYCLIVEDDIEEEDFVREIMCFLPQDQGREHWCERVASLYGGKTTWRQFSQSLADSLSLQGGWQEDDRKRILSPFQTVEAKLATRAYLRHLKEKPEEADQLFRAFVDGFSTLPSSDGAWDVVQRLSQGMSPTSALQLADEHWYHQSHGDNTEEDQTEGTSHGPLGQTVDTSMESQDGMHPHPNSSSHHISQFTAARDDDVHSTDEDPFIPESLFSLAEVQRAINSFSNDGISFNELRNILLTDTPPIHAQAVRNAFQKLNPYQVDIKILNALLEKLQEEMLAVTT